MCVGGGLNVIGLFVEFIDDFEVCFYGFEVGGDGVEIGCYVVLIIRGFVGVLYGICIYIL